MPSLDRGRRRDRHDDHIRYSAAACQTDLANPLDRSQMRANTDRMLSMIDAAVAGGAPFLPVRLVVFPEFAHAAPVYPTVARAAREARGADPERAHRPARSAKAREHGVYIQSGSMIEADPRWPGVVFNTTCLIGPEGILYKYRKVNPWIPYEVHASPHDLAGYDEPLFPVADTPIGRHRLRDLLRLAVPRGDPPARRQRRRSADPRVRLHGSVGRDRADELVDDREPLPRAREHRLRRRREPGREPAHYPPYSWPGGSQVVDFDGRMLAEASPGPGERIVVAPIDITALRHERATRRGHHMLAHLRTEAYPVYAAAPVPAGVFAASSPTSATSS